MITFNDYTKKNLLYFIRMYNSYNDNKLNNYNKLSKAELVKLCTKHFKIEMSNVYDKNWNILNIIAKH